MGRACRSYNRQVQVELEWVCFGQGNKAIVSLAPDGERSPLGCGVCSDGARIDENCRTCDGGSNVGLLCLRADDCPGANCAADNTQCPGLCSDFSTECTSDGDCPGGETCTGIAPGACDALLACETGGCCDPDTGTCSDGETVATCTAPREFLGLGTDCEPNCCVQPVFTGGDNCDEVDIHHVTVPEATICVGGANNGMPCSTTADCGGKDCARTVVVTLSGDN